MAAVQNLSPDQRGTASPANGPQIGPARPAHTGDAVAARTTAVLECLCPPLLRRRGRRPARPRRRHQQK